MLDIIGANTGFLINNTAVAHELAVKLLMLHLKMEIRNSNIYWRKRKKKYQ
jgi:hypothetical protein